ncbi:MAG: CopL family metal-binding regulatory protein [Steroidobacteraceae bacterium]
MRDRFHPLAALLLLAVLHNGVAAPSMAAPDAAPPADAGMAHHGHGGMTDMGSGGHPADHTAPDCCDPSSCDCGCTATPAALLRPATAARDWQRAESTRAADATGIHPAATGAPFRPPA